MKNNYFKIFSVILSFILVLCLISPSLAQAQENTYSDSKQESLNISNKQIPNEENLEKPQFNIEGPLVENVDEEVEIQPFVLPLVARIILSGGSKFLRVSRGTEVLRTHPVYIHTGKQGKHILNHANFKVGNSILTENANDLLRNYAGKGTMVTEVKERVSFGKIIGEFYDINTKHYLPTKNGMIHYSKTGAHIVPSRP